MKFERIAIQKYGPFENRVLDLGGSPGLSIVYGLNEAGKSTFLESIFDFLFGIPNNSTRGGTFGYDNIRLEATISLPDGTRRSFCRKKGRVRTLTDENGNPLADETLLSILGAVTRERFNTLFGLDHSTLRMGGTSLLEAEGEIGRLIIEAGGGLRSLMDSLKSLNEKAEGLFSTRRAASREFYKALDDYSVADQTVKSKLLKVESVAKGRRELESANELLANARSLRKQLAETISKYERLTRVTPILIKMTDLEGQLNEFQDVSDLPNEFSSQVRQAVRDKLAAQTALSEVESDLNRLKSQIDALDVSEQLLHKETKIKEINAKAIVIEQQRNDRPNRQLDIEGDTTTLESLCSALSIDPESDLSTLCPERAVIEKVQDLFEEGVQLKNRLDSLVNQKTEIDISIQILEAKQTRRCEFSQDKPSGFETSELSQLGQMLATLNAKEGQVLEQKSNITSRVSAQGFDTAEDLIDLRLPKIEMVSAQAQLRGKLTGEREAIDRVTEECELSIKQAEAEVTRLSSAGILPSTEGIQAIRNDRNEAWEQIRSTYSESTGKAFASLSALDREGQASRLDSGIKESDNLVDARFSETKRLSDLDTQNKHLTQAHARLNHARERWAAATERIEKTEREWLSNWPEAGARVADLDHLRLLIESREKVQEAFQTCRNLERQIEIERPKIDLLIQSLVDAENAFDLQPSDDVTIEKRARNIFKVIQDHENAYQEFLRAQEELEEKQVLLERRNAELDECKDRMSIWQKLWDEAIRQMGIPNSLSLLEGSRLAAHWSEARGVISSLEKTKRRLWRMDEDESKLSELINGAAIDQSNLLPDDSVEAGKFLYALWNDEHTKHLKKHALLEQLVDIESDIQEKKSAVDKTECAVEILNVTGVDLADLLILADRFDDYCKIRVQHKQIKESIIAASDGFGIEELENQREAKGIDQIRGELEESRNRLNECEKEVEDSARHAESLKNELIEITKLDGGNEAVAQREAAAARMRQISKRYIELIVTAEIIRLAIDQLREQEQDPLIQRAGQLFKIATGGNYVGIVTDIDVRGLPIVVGKRNSGELVLVNQMSDGTRDQLFLAFRVASIENYCQSAEAVPFIGDDLLVHFDDYRTEETIRMLAELGKTTQVLLFTHHKKVCDLAESVISQGLGTVIDLSAVHASTQVVIN